MNLHLRFHGRGGEGVKLASRIVSRAAFLAGCTVQDSPLYGAERRGAPVVAFARISDRPILDRGYIDTPDVVMVMDASLLGLADAAVLHGVRAHTAVVVNTPLVANELRDRFGIGGIVLTYDLSTMALQQLGHHHLSAPVAGVAAKLAGVCTRAQLLMAIDIELTEIGVTKERIECNAAISAAAFDATETLTFDETTPTAPRLDVKAFAFPRLPARIAAPSISVAATSAQRHMQGWRTQRPLIDLLRCTRCFFCFALCPDGAIHLDADHFPIVDYEHCKGCLICVEECPPKAIHAAREEVAA